MKGVLVGSATATIFVAGFLIVSGWSGSEIEKDPQQLARAAYVTECMEARTGWRRGTNGFYNSTTQGQRMRMAELCGIDFDEGRVDQVVQAVRNGELQIRGQIDPYFHSDAGTADRIGE
jgi:anti-sigma28 factor (negative regulator of flagellin synthesis)